MHLHFNHKLFSFPLNEIIFYWKRSTVITSHWFFFFLTLSQWWHLTENRFHKLLLLKPVICLFSSFIRTLSLDICVYSLPRISVWTDEIHPKIHRHCTAEIPPPDISCFPIEKYRKVTFTITSRNYSLFFSFFCCDSSQQPVFFLHRLRCNINRGQGSQEPYYCSET